MVDASRHRKHRGQVGRSRHVSDLGKEDRQPTVTAEKSNRIRIWRALTWPNRISIGRLLLIPPFVLLLINIQQWPWARTAAIVIFVAMALSDAVDGFLARKLEQTTRLGAILDPIADKALIIVSVVLLSLETTSVPGSRLPNWVAVAVVGKDLWVILGFTIVYLVTDRFRVHAVWAGKLATACQLILVISVLVSPELDDMHAGLGAGLVNVLGWLVVVISVLAVVSYTRLGLHFVMEDQKPLDES